MINGGDAGPRHLGLLNPALDVFCFLIQPLVSAIEHFFESVEFTFIMRVVSCVLINKKKRYKKHHCFPYNLVQTYYSLLDVLYSMFCTLFKNLFEYLCAKSCKRYCASFWFLQEHLATGGILVIPQLLAFSQLLTAWNQDFAKGEHANRLIRNILLPINDKTS